MRLFVRVMNGSVDPFGLVGDDRGVAGGLVFAADPVWVVRP